MLNLITSRPFSTRFSQMLPPRKWGPHKKQRREEDPVKEVMQAVARGQEELEEDVLLEQHLVDGLEGSDYYDDKGKIATVRRKKRWTFERRKKRLTEAKTSYDRGNHINPAPILPLSSSILNRSNTKLNGYNHRLVKQKHVFNIYIRENS